MPNSPARLAAIEVPVADTVIYTVTAPVLKTIVTEIFVVNTADASASVSMRLNTLNLLDDVVIPANGFMQQGLKQVLNAGDVIGITGTVAGMNVFISGVEVTA